MCLILIIWLASRQFLDTHILPVPDTWVFGYFNTRYPGIKIYGYSTLSNNRTGTKTSYFGTLWPENDKKHYPKQILGANSESPWSKEEMIWIFIFIKPSHWKFGAVTFFITSHFLFDIVEYTHITKKNAKRKQSASLFIDLTSGVSLHTQKG